MENNTIIQNPVENQSKSFSQTRKILFFILGILVFVFLLYFLFLYAPKNYPVGKIQFIKTGSSLRSVSLMLKDDHVIKSRIAFETSVMILGGERHIIPGDYLFERKLPVYEVARRIISGDKQLEPFRVTIPEGYNKAEIAAVFETKLPHFNQEEFLKVAKEGYLFPDTYFFSTDATEVEVLEYMDKNYEDKVEPLREEIARSGKSEKDIIIMASIIEREAKGEKDRREISGILWRRLKIGMALQVDAWPPTYKTRGLPDEPIANPGLAAIEASINPVETPYLYYLHADDGTIYFAKSFDEHKRNIAKYLK